MGKYTRRAKLIGDTVAIMDVSHSSHGVRTRAKTLALQKLQSLKSTTAPPPSPATEHRPESSYLQLRSRRLEKPPFQQLTCCRQQNPNPSLVNCSGVSNSVGSGSVETRIETGEETEEGENNLDFDGRERSTRESTPCSSINDFNALSTPGSSTRSGNLEASNQISNNSITRSMPLAREIEEFFDVHEQDQLRRFADKYNFDFVNEKPLEGCYEWVKVESE